jgi:hypothetical protein
LIAAFCQPLIHLNLQRKLVVHITNQDLGCSVRYRDQQFVEITLLEMRDQRADMQIANP